MLSTEKKESVPVSAFVAHQQNDGSKRKRKRGKRKNKQKQQEAENQNVEELQVKPVQGILENGNAKKANKSRKRRHKKRKSEESEAVKSQKLEVSVQDESAMVESDEERKTKTEISVEPDENKKKSKTSDLDAEDVEDVDVDDAEDVEEDDDDEDDEEELKMIDPNEIAKNLFQSIIHPTKEEDFFKTYWEKKPLLIKRNDPTFNFDWFSCEDLDTILRVERIMFGEHIDVTSYRNNQRETHNSEGRALASVIWDFYQSGCSVRMLNPQTYHQDLWERLSILQEYFGSFVGANVYLTPPGTQGFAPHYDDIEAFILQLEGKKHWLVYPPRGDRNTLPRVSSRNFGQKGLGKPIMDVVLEAGDLLYFPRGFVHQGNTLNDHHSLHITISTYQKSSWADLFSKMLQPALNKAISEDLEFRRGLPLNYLKFMGKVFSDDKASCDKNSEERRKFRDHVLSLFSRLTKYLPVDAGCDELGVELVHDSLPPALDTLELSHSAIEGGEKWSSRENQVVDAIQLEPDTKVRLARYSSVRLEYPSGMKQEDEQELAIHRLYHAVDNTRIYHEMDPTFLDIEEECVGAVEHLIRSYPSFVSVEDLPAVDLETKMLVATGLYERGVLVTEYDLEPWQDNPSENEEEVEEDFEEKVVDEYDGQSE